MTRSSSVALSRRALLAGGAAAATGLALSSCSFFGSSGGGSSSGPLRMSSFQPADVVKIWKPQFADFEKAHGVGVKHEYTARANQNQALLTQATSGSLPDVALISASSFAALASRGLLESLDGVDFTHYSLADQAKVLRNTYRWKGAPLGIGTDLDLGLLFSNTALFEKAGVAPPTETTTYSEFRTIARQLTSGSGSGKYYGLDTGGYGGALLLLHSMAWSMGGQVVDDETRKVTLADGPGREALDLIVSMLGQDGSIPPPNSDGATMTNGRIAMGMYGAWGAYYILGNVDFPWAVTRLPRAAEQETYGSGSCLVVFRSTKKKEAAGQFLDFFLQKKYQLQRASDWAWTPPMTAVLESSGFGSSGALKLEPDQRDVVTGAAATARALPLVVEQVKFESAFSDVLTKVATGSMGTADAADQLTSAWQPLLDA